MTAYVSHKLNISLTDAHQLRDKYWKVYGATLKGLIQNHGMDPQEFLLNTHDAEELKKYTYREIKRKTLIYNKR
mgnify:CR=1 FL=1